jgi:hypothetical protein
MGEAGYGTWRIDGPLPEPPVYGLLQAAAAPAAGVTIVPDVDDQGRERWLDGVTVYPYPPGPALAWDSCARGTAPLVTKDDGADVENPEFAAMTIYLAERCRSRKVWDQASFKARATTSLAAFEGGAVAREFMSGEVLPLSPHLADGNGSFPNGDTPTSPINGLALLEGEIGLSRQLGVIHMSPQLAIWLSNYHVLDLQGKILRTKVGTPVIPDAGYTEGASPAGHAAASPGQQWMYATGTIEVRRSEMFVTPERVDQALERGTGGASTGRPNTIVYRAERYYLVDWDTQVQAAVLVDLCSTEC